MSFYKLPGPWNPGYVIPRYVQAEPPERGTITTQWLPRGTIPQLIPDYLAVPENQVKSMSTLAKSSLSGTCFDEGTLQGHSLAGDSLGAREYVLEPLGGTSNGKANHFTRYGQKVAKNLMARMQRLPQDQRATVMKKTLAAIDNTLPGRAERYARAAKQRGMNAPAALEHGIARAITDGAMTELAQIGRRGRPMALSGASRGRGLIQLALGALPLTSIKQSILDTQPITVTGATTGMSNGQCSADGQFVWVAATSTSPGYWQRLAAGQTCASYTVDPSQSPDIRVHAPGSSTGVTDPNTITATPGSYRTVEVGPFNFPADLTWSRATYWGKPLPLDWQTFIKRVVTKDPVASFTMGGWVGAPTVFNAIPSSTRINPKYFGINKISANPDWAPVARTTHPDNGKDYGVWLSVTHRYPDKPIAADNPEVLNVIFAPVSKTVWGAIWDWIENLGSKIVDVVGDALDAVKDATCSLLQQPGVAEAAVTQAAAAPTPATAGAAAGVVIGQQLCGGVKQPQAPTGPAGSSGSGWILPVAIGGGALLAIYALTR